LLDVELRDVDPRIGEDVLGEDELGAPRGPGPAGVLAGDDAQDLGGHDHAGVVVLAAALREEIVDGLLQGRLAVGDPLPSERELLDRFEVARPTFREAMRILEAESLIELRVGKKGGAFVSTPTSEVAAAQVALLLQLRRTTVEDIWELRATLEPSAVRLVAAHPSAEGIAELRALIAELETVVADTPAFVRISLTFQDALVAQTGNETLRLLCALIHDILEAGAFAAARAIRRPPAKPLAEWNHLAARANVKLVDLIEAGDADGAEAFWRRHLDALGSLFSTSYGENRLIDAMAVFSPRS
jgi:DNA-binding FadR family transcriptional regulator